MTKTTIQLSVETKAMLEEAKLSDESYDAALRRLLEDGGASLWTESDIRAIARSEAEAVIEDVTQHGL